MGLSDEQIHKIVKLKDDLYSRITEHQEAIELLESNLEILDIVLKESSFIKASSLVAKTPDKNTEDVKDIIPITGGSDGKVVAQAHVTPEQITITIEPNIKVNTDTPPFKSFFLDRIIGGMSKKDLDEANAGKIQKESIINHVITTDDQYIKEIIIENYRHKDRVNEIINTVGWSLARMLENIK